MDRYSQSALILGGVALGATVVLAVQTLDSSRRRRRQRSADARQSTLTEDIKNGLEECIGNTPLIRIRSLSEATGCDILGKAEVLQNLPPHPPHPPPTHTYTRADIHLLHSSLSPEDRLKTE